MLKMINIKPLRWAFDHVSWQPSKEQFIQAMSRIQPEERSRVMQFVFRKDIRPALVGRLMLRSCAAQILSLSNNDIKFSRADKGKPIIDNVIQTPFDLNVSHHGNYVVLACDATDKLGIDIMEIEMKEELDKYFKLMNRTFSPNEWTFIREGSSFDTDSSARAQMSRFLRLWSLKEAYFKAEGMGITTDLRSIEFICKSKTDSERIISDTQIKVYGKLLTECTFYESLIDEDHCVAVCIFHNHSLQGDYTSHKFLKLTFDQLVSNLSPFLDADQTDLGSKWQLYESKEESPGKR